MRVLIMSILFLSSHIHMCNNAMLRHSLVREVIFFLCSALFEGKTLFYKLWTMLDLRAELDLRSTNLINLPDSMTDQYFSIFSFNVSKEICDALLNWVGKDCFFRNKIAFPFLQLWKTQLDKESHWTTIKCVHSHTPLERKIKKLRWWYEVTSK